jgi:hypothetical protein
MHSQHLHAPANAPWTYECCPISQVTARVRDLGSGLFGTMRSNSIAPNSSTDAQMISPPPATKAVTSSTRRTARSSGAGSGWAERNGHCQSYFVSFGIVRDRIVRAYRTPQKRMPASVPVCCGLRRRLAASHISLPYTTRHLGFPQRGP